MKISVSSYCFTRVGLTQFEAVEKARSMGFKAIEFAGLTPPEGMNINEYSQTLASLCRKTELEVSCLSVSADFLRNNPADETERVKRLVDCAELLNAPFFRTDATKGDGRPFDTALPILCSCLRDISAYGETKGIKIMTENHGIFCQDSARMEKLVAGVNHSNYALLADMGNFLCADENPSEAMGIAAAYAAYVHAKDFHVKPGNSIDPGEGFGQSRNGNFLRGAIIGHGDLPLVHCLRALKNVGYDGWIAIEFEGIEAVEKGVAIGRKNLETALRFVGYEL